MHCNGPVFMLTYNYHLPQTSEVPLYTEQNSGIFEHEATQEYLNSN